MPGWVYGVRGYQGTTSVVPLFSLSPDAAAPTRGVPGGEMGAVAESPMGKDLSMSDQLEQLRQGFADKAFGDVMIVGGGISGVQASLDLASAGFKVYLVEKAPSIGGHMAQLDKTFPTNDCSM